MCVKTTAVLRVNKLLESEEMGVFSRGDETLDDERERVQLNLIRSHRRGKAVTARGKFEHFQILALPCGIAD